MVELAFYPLRRDPAGDAVVAIAPLLLIYAPRQSAVAGLRLSRRVLPDPFQHGRPLLERRSQSAQSVRALRRLALAAAVLLRLPSALPYFMAACGSAAVSR
jgi:hypothetical protein